MYHLSGKYKLKTLDGDENFINLLRHVSIYLSMVTINSQPSLKEYQKKYYKPKFISWYPKGIYEKLNECHKFEILFRPFISGYVTEEIFWKLLSIDQSELIIIGNSHFKLI